MRLESLSKWISFVSFVCQLFTELQNYSDLQDIVYNCLFTLVGPECLQNDSEVDCLVTQLLSIGKQLEECNRDVMDELYDNIRDAYLAWNSPASSRLPLLQAIELRAMKWQLDDDAKEYYYGEYTMSAI
uniref:MIF4G domain-containing protein B-like n=1 Tax=Saccoglossus kowalevskii TaxID=10224 RepID=A0ABM0M3Z8_SACKO|nr:PREDICTED: MIF4G domain-containing protein B-like [Saccoglossus kowalevskii]